MSSQTIVLNTGQQAIITTDTSRIFLWENRYKDGLINNATYDDVTMLAGTLLGRVAATQELVVCKSGASDGSQYPVGILATDIIIAAGAADVTIPFCEYGDVAEEKVIFDGSDDFDTVVSDRSLRDRIGADTVGIRLITGTEMTDYDNS